MDKLLLDHNLQKLSDMLQAEQSPYVRAVKYLKSLKVLYSRMVSKTLSDDYADVIDTFRELFDEMYDIELINFTVKIHLLYHHLEDYMRETEGTLFFADTSGILQQLSNNNHNT